jgi:hypothetical protein
VASGRAFHLAKVSTGTWAGDSEERSGHISLSLSKLSKQWHVQELELLLRGTHAGLSTKHSLQHKTQRACQMLRQQSRSLSFHYLSYRHYAYKTVEYSRQVQESDS